MPFKQLHFVIRKSMVVIHGLNNGLRGFPEAVIRSDYASVVGSEITLDRGSVKFPFDSVLACPVYGRSERDSIEGLPL